MTDPAEGDIVMTYDGRENYARVTIGAYDPARWESGGDVEFGMGVDLTVSRSFSKGRKAEVRVQIGGIAAHGLATGRLRAEAYRLAIELGESIRERLYTEKSIPLAVSTAIADSDIPLIVRGGTNT